MQNDNRHNGWDNYETWAVSLWLSNEQSSADYWSGAARDILDASEADLERDYTREMVAMSALADQLKEHHEQALPEVQGFAADLLNAAMSEVNWLEIAIHLVNDAQAELATH